MKNILWTLFLAAIVTGCSKDKPIEISSEDYHRSVERLTDVMVHDIFSPPVASRIYAYSNIAAYEVIAQNNEKFDLLNNVFEELEPIPKADSTKQINLRLAALIAQMEIGRKLIFSEEKILIFQDSLSAEWKEQNEEMFHDSEEYGKKVAQIIGEWLNKDNYQETRMMPRFSVHSEDPSRWQPTPPAYMDGIEPHWAKIRPFVLDSASQFMPPKHPEFSMKENSDFYNELMEVYNVRKTMEEPGEEMKMAKFWDCNPYVSTTRGHLMFATKKITPGGHWIGICKIACEKSKLDFEETVYAYTTTSIAMADAFISTWDEKYRSELIRPETLINKYIDEDWKPILQTPPFPEYPSGHSVVSGAAATVLTQLFGDLAFDDDTEVKYGLPVRSFNSFNEAAEEAAISRLYGGIHYRFAIEKGLDQGRALGAYVVNDLEVRPLKSLKE